MLLENIVQLLPKKWKKKPNGTKEIRGTILDKKMIEGRPVGANGRIEIGILKVTLLLKAQ